MVHRPEREDVGLINFTESQHQVTMLSRTITSQNPQLSSIIEFIKCYINRLHLLESFLNHIFLYSFHSYCDQFSSRFIPPFSLHTSASAALRSRINRQQCRCLYGFYAASSSGHWPQERRAPADAIFISGAASRRLD